MNADYIARLRETVSGPSLGGTAKTAKTQDAEFTRFLQFADEGPADTANHAEMYPGSGLWRRVGEFYDACKAREDVAPRAWCELREMLFAFEEAIAEGFCANWVRLQGPRLLELAAELDGDKVLEGAELYRAVQRVFGMETAQGSSGQDSEKHGTEDRRGL